MEKCLICNQEFEDFNRHPYRAHQLTLADYYLLHYPRHDKLTGQAIPFKDKETYFETDFSSRDNLIKWLFSVDKEVAQQHAKDVLVRRKQSKKLVYAPCQVELRSISYTPSVVGYMRLFGDYEGLCGSLGFKVKYHSADCFDGLLIGDIKPALNTNIIIDTREQHNIRFSHPTQVKKLDFGDYSTEDPASSGGIYVERKSLEDFIGTMSHGLERFHKEIKRAERAGAHLFIVVEESLVNVLNFRTINSVCSKLKVGPSFIFHNVRELIQEYPHVQFIFVKSREESARIILQILFCKGLLKQYDCQLLYDLDLLRGIKNA